MTTTASPQRLSGQSLGQSLGERWTRLPRRQARRLCASPTLAEALRAALPVLLNGTLVRAHVTPDYTDVGFIHPAPTDAGRAAGSDGGRLCVLSYTTAIETRWQAGPVPDMRVSLLARMLHEAVTSPHSAHSLLSHSQSHPAWQALALDYWWDARLHEGHTPETAAFMLALLLPPCTQVTYDHGRPVLSQ